MNLTISPAWSRLRQLPSAKLPYQIAEFALIALLALAAAQTIPKPVAPLGPVGDWKASGSTSKGDESVLARFDPFFRTGAATGGGPTVVTNLPIKLFGVRVNQAIGRGSAIIATPDGVQSSYAVGDEIMPGVKLKAVTFEGVTIDRGGADEQIFLDQSVAATVAQPSGAAPPPSGQMVAPVAAPAAAATALANEIALQPYTQKGQIVGFTVSPKGSGGLFRMAGLKEGDVLTAINGQPIRTSEDVTKAVASNTDTANMMLSVERGGKAMTLSARVKP
jgi:general secretion pathway protein C